MEKEKQFTINITLSPYVIAFLENFPNGLYTKDSGGNLVGVTETVIMLLNDVLNDNPD